MPRKGRIEYEGAVYHVMDRGDRLEAIFLDGEDRRIFLKTLWQACERTGWRVHSYVLMTNHYHLLLETPEANLSSGMRWFQATYTIRHNVRHRLRGHLFQGRYKAIVVDGEERTYFITVSDYIHLNPVRAGLLGGEQQLVDFPWSSFPALIGSPRKRPTGLVAERVIGAAGDRDNVMGRRRYRDAMEKRAVEERAESTIDATMLKSLRRGWCFGAEDFRQSLIEKCEAFSKDTMENKRKSKYHDEREAERIVREGMRCLGIIDFQGHRKGSPEKIALASLVKSRTVATNLWIARRLQMGDASRVSRYCGEAESRPEVRKIKNRLKKAQCKN
jgi:putative transposase